MKKLLTLLAPFLFFLFASAATFAQVTSNKIDSLMEEVIIKFKVAGASIAVVKDGKVIYKKGFGVKSIETKLPVNESTNFAIGSNSKAFTTAALAILVEDGKLSWNDKVKKLLIEFIPKIK